MANEIDFRGKDFDNTSFCRQDLRGANFEGVDLSRITFYKTDLRGANFIGANLIYSAFRSCKLAGADFRGANFYGADIRTSNIDEIITDKTTKWFQLHCPEEGDYIAWKKCFSRRREDRIVKLLIPADALRSSATTNKCRASKAKVLEIWGKKWRLSKAYSWFDRNFVYEVGDTLMVSNFDHNRWCECSTGIHHFLTRQEAIDWTI